MFEKIKNTVTSEEFKRAAGQVALNIGSSIVVGLAIKGISYVAVEGTKALVNEIKSHVNDQESE